MLIDWFTVGAQIINFLILLLLLKIFLFDRVVRAMDEREEKISARFADAKSRERQAREKVQSLEDDKRALEENRHQLIAEAKEDAEAKRRQWAEQARHAVEQQRRQWEDTLANQKEEFKRDLQRLAAQQVCTVCRRVLQDLADEALEARIIEGFLRRIAEMERGDKDKFSRSPDAENSTVTIRSAFEVSKAMRRKIAGALKRDLSEDRAVIYEFAPDMFAGIELSAGGKRIGWSVGNYLRSLEDNVMQALQGQAPKDSGRSGEQTPAESE